MRIGVFCTNEYTTPPPSDVIYAPLQVTQQIADGLTERGHQVTVYAPKGSRMKSTVFTNDLVALKKNKMLLPFTIRHNERTVGSYEHLALSSLFKHALEGRFDLVHVHPAIRGIFYPQFVKIPVVFTLHDPIDAEKKFFFERCNSKNTYFVSISNAQRKGAPHLQWAGTVYNGIYPKRFPFNAKPGKHFIVIGRLVPDKGIFEAIQAARIARVPLHIAGMPNCGPYWERKIKPYLSKTITYVGMIPYDKMPHAMSQSRGLLFPIKWEEPFGLVMAEAMACGTPVIAFKHGSVSEVAENNKTGFIVNTVSEMAKAIRSIDTIDRSYCRTHATTKFSVENMVTGYEKIFRKLIARHNDNKKNN